AKRAATKASARATLPRLAFIRGGELRRALGHERAGFPHEHAVLPDFAFEDDLAAAAEGVRHRARVGDRQARGPSFPVDDPEGKAFFVSGELPYRALDHLAGHLGVGAGRSVDE